jgi:hypothetical protein
LERPWSIKKEKMLKVDKYFDNVYEYADLWSAGLIKAYMPNAEGEIFLRLKVRVVEALMDRFDAVNALRKSIGLDPMSIEDAYDYYVNNIPEFDEKKKVFDLYNFDLKTRELADKEESFAINPNAVAYLYVMGAPDVFIENSHVVQERLDHINRLLVEGGFNKITPNKTEEILTKLLMTQEGM